MYLIRVLGQDDHGIDCGTIFEMELPINFKMTVATPTFCHIQIIKGQFLGILFDSEDKMGEFSRYITKVCKKRLELDVQELKHEATSMMRATFAK